VEVDAERGMNERRVQGDGARPALLIISDDAETRRRVVDAARRSLPDAALRDAARFNDVRAELTDGAPDVVLFDTQLAPDDGGNPVRLIHDYRPDAAVILITDELTPGAARALHDGAQDVLLRADLTEDLLARAIANAITGRRSRTAARSRMLRTSGGDAFRTIIGTIADGIVIVDDAGTTRFVNPAAERLFGRSAEDLVGEEFGFPVVSGETAEFEILNPQLGPITAELRVTDTEWDGQPARLAAVRDVTERIRAQTREKQLVREQTLRAAAEAGERRARFLGEAATILAASLDYHTELQSLAQLMVPFMADWCIIDLLEPDGTFKRAAVATASPAGAALVPMLRRAVPRTEPDSGAARALRSGEPQLGLAIDAPAMHGILGIDHRAPELARASLGCCIVLPLTVRDARFGIITLCDAESGRIFDDDDLDLAAEIARRAASAIDNGRLYNDAQRANQAKADFLAVMSHELRTPLNAVIGYADLLMMGVPVQIPDPAAEHVRRIRSSARHLLSLIEEILTFSRIEAGREQLLIEDVDVHPLIDEVAAVIEPLARRYELDFSVQLPEPPLTLETDAQKLRQILLNLLSNAVKFTEVGSVTLSVLQEDDDVSFTIADTGRGIDAADLAHIFDPFWQVEQTRTRRAEGTGLGLSVARRLAHLLGGDIFVHSEPGRGSEFTLRLHCRLPRAVHDRLRSDSVPD
jgi:signal transduction histidine kinase/PAS domain-containing protein